MSRRLNASFLRLMEAQAPSPTVRIRVRVPVVLAMETAEGARILQVSISRYWVEWLRILHERGNGGMTVDEIREKIFRRLSNGGNGHG